jgi:Fur family transcriptional regulator, peroxide stress response regulator
VAARVARMRSPDDLTSLFRARGLKVTPQRQCIFRILHEADGHPTAEAVHAEAAAVMPTMSLRTVYQTLHDLAGMGEIQQLDLGTGSSRFDPNVDAHHHLVCTTCGRVRDVYVDAGVMAIPADAAEGFTVRSTEVVLRGTCDTCTATSVSQSTPTHKEEQAHA